MSTPLSDQRKRPAKTLHFSIGVYIATLERGLVVLALGTKRTGQQELNCWT